GLGAILCQILTGTPPYGGRGEEALEQARQADLGDALARLCGHGTDGELVRLALGCLAPRPQDGPRAAGVVAERGTAYLAGGPEGLRQAELERAAAEAREKEARGRAEAEAQARRAERRARQRTRALAAAVLGSLLLGVGGWLWIERDRQTRRDDTIRN